MTELFDNYRENYNEVVQGSIDFSGKSHDFFMVAKVEKLRSILASRFPGKDLASLSYLDVGCGVGAFHPFVQDLLPDISGCDISSDSIARARIDNPFAGYKHYDGKTLPYEDASFDVLTTICVVHHVPPAQWPSFFAEMRRVTKPGGICCVIEHNPLNPATRLAVARCPFDEDAVLLNHWKASSLARQAGFSRTTAEYFLLLPSDRPFARSVEGTFKRLPLGAQYVLIADVD